MDYQLKQNACPTCLQQAASTEEDENDKVLNDPSNQSTEPLKIVCSGHTEICHWTNDNNKNITFKLEDGSEVKANRELLATRNEFFKGLLKGHFAESNSEQVPITSISKPCLEFIIHFLYECSCTTLYRGNMESYLELLFASEMYFLHKLRNYAAYKVISQINKAEDVLRIYESGVGRIHEDSILHALCIVLVKPMKTWKRARWIKSLFTSKFSEDIIHNISMILKYPLDVNREICNCDMTQSLYMVSENVYEKL